jgi:mRNA-degrading endonuclease RelE of RelBE toxin-antitoxin system
MYKDQYHPQVKKDLKKLDRKAAAEFWKTHLLRILSDPGEGDLLVGDLAGIRSYHFQVVGKDYRVAYVASSKDLVVYILMIAKRENFYDILKRRI